MTISSVGGTSSPSFNPIDANKVDTVEALLAKAITLTAQFKKDLPNMINYPPDRLASFEQQVITLDGFAAEPNAAQRVAAIPGATLELAATLKLLAYNANQCEAQIALYGKADYSKPPLSDELKPFGTISIAQDLMANLITRLKNNGF